VSQSNDRPDDRDDRRVVLAPEPGAVPARIVVEVVQRPAEGPGPARPRVVAADGAQPERLEIDVTEAGTRPHLATLQRIADENGGNRACPSPGYEVSVRYVVDVLTAAGYDVSTPRYPLPKKRRHAGETSCANVLAQTRTGDPARVLVIGAHLDSVRKGPGINDNGSGVAALLEIATRLGGSPSVRNAVRFAFWGSEEDDMEGSTHYVRTLTRADRTDIMLYVNVDMIASSNAGYFVQGGEGKSRKKFGPPGSPQVAVVLVEQLAAAGVVARTIPFDGESDFAPFINAGIPSGGVMTGDRQKKTEKQALRWGGTAGERFDPQYHTPRDRIEKLDLVAMGRFTRALAGTVAHFAMTSDGVARREPTLPPK
jgi:aminopeptidase S